MERNELDSLVVKKRPKKEKVFTVKVDQKAYDTLQKRGVDIAKTIQNLLERLAD